MGVSMIPLSTNELRVGCLAADGDAGRHRIALVREALSNRGVLEALGANRKCDAADGRRIRGNGAEGVVVRERQTIRARGQQRPSELLISRGSSDLAAQPPAAV